MLKFVGETGTGQGKILGLGLSLDNMNSLAEGDPIVIDLVALGMGPGIVVLFGGKTEDEMMAMLKRLGVPIDVVIDQRGGTPDG